MKNKARQEVSGAYSVKLVQMSDEFIFLEYIIAKIKHDVFCNHGCIQHLTWFASTAAHLCIFVVKLRSGVTTFSI